MSSPSAVQWVRRLHLQVLFVCLTTLATAPCFAQSANGTLAAGESHACAVVTGGAVRCWGWNELGSVGDGTTINRSTAVNVVGLASGVSFVAAGYAHSCAVNSAGGVACWGNNYSGQLGDGTKTQRNSPVQVTGLTSGAVALALGGQHSCALMSSGAVQCWGSNGWGQLGDGTGIDQLTPIVVPGISAIALVRSGDDTTCAVTTGGALVCWGDSYQGNAGNGHVYDTLYSPETAVYFPNGAAAVAVGATHTCVVTTAGGAKCFGANTYGQLGDGTNTDNVAPVNVLGLSSGVVSVTAGYSGACALTSTGSVPCWGGTAGSSSVPVVFTGLEGGATEISGGSQVACARFAAEIKCWGSNQYGSVGDGTTTNRWNAPTTVLGLGGGGGTSQTITFGALGGKAMGNAPFAVSATASSGLTVVFTSTTTGVCTVSGTTVTLVGAGTCTIAANQPGDAAYAAAAQVTQSFAVAKGAQTITFGALAGRNLGDAPFTVGATASSGLAVAFTSSTTAVCTVSGTTVTMVATGTCTIAANQAGNANWNAATQVSQSFTVGAAKTAQTITFGALGGKYANDPAFAVTATASSGLAVVFTSTTPGVCTVSGTTVTLVAAGTCTIAANQPGDATYAVAAQVTQSFTVGAARTAQTISFGALAGKAMGNAPFTVSATATSGLAVAFSSTTTGVCTVSGNTVTLVAVGTCTIAANQAGNATYQPATQVSQSFAVAKGAQTISFGTLVTKYANDPPFALAATASSGLAVTYSSSTPAVCTVSGSTATLVAAGTCTIAANQAGNANWNAATQVSQSFTVGAARTAQTISFGALAGKAMGNAPFAVSATATSGLAVAFTSTTTAVCTVSGSTVTLVGAGTCTVAADQSGNATYQPAPQVTQSFAVAKGAQTISFPAPPAKYANDPPFALTATSTSGLAVAYTSATTGVCTVSGSNVTLVAAGTCTLNANQAGNANWNAATQVSQSVTVGAARTAQTITFGALSGKAMGNAPFTVSATATSGLAVAFSSTTTGVCTVSGSTVTLVAVGTCTIAANQAGNATYQPATQVSQSFAVAKGAQTISFAALATRYVNDAPFALTATSTSGLAVSYSSSTTGICTVSGSTVTLVAVGTCTIAANQAGDANWNAATQVSQSFTVGAARTAQTITFGALAGKAMGNAPFAVSATASSGLAVAFSSTTTAVCTASGGTVTLVAAGTCTVAANQAGNATYQPAPQVTQSFAVAKGAQTISFPAPPAKYANDPPFALTATSTSGLAVSYTSSTPAVCTVSGSTATLLAAGNCTLAADQAGNANWNAATQVSLTFTVSGARTPQTITFATIPAKTIGDLVVTTPTATSGLEVVLTSSTPAICTVGGTTITTLAAGTCTINANQPGDPTYAAAPQVSRSFTVGKLLQTIAFGPPGSTISVGNAVGVRADSTSELPVAFASSTPAVCTIAGITLSPLTVGTCTLVASQSGNATYSAATNVSVSFPIAKGNQNVVFVPPPPFNYQAGAPQLTATGGGSGNPVVFSSTTTNTCTVGSFNGQSWITAIGAGICGITATQAGDANYNAGSASGSVVIGKGTTTVTFAALGNLAFGTGSSNLAGKATAANGGTIVYSSATPSVCSVSSGYAGATDTVTPIYTGLCTVVATFPASRDYNAAEASQSFTVTSGALSPQAITGFTPATPVVFGGGGTFTLAATGGASGNPVTFTSTTSAVCAVMGSIVTMQSPGKCQLIADQLGNASFAPAIAVNAEVVISSVAQVPSLVNRSAPAAYYNQPYFGSMMIGSSSPISQVYVADLPNGINCTGTPRLGGIVCTGSPTESGDFTPMVTAINDTGASTTPMPMHVANVSASVTAIAAGDSHTCAVARGGVRCWGGNDKGQLGNNAVVDSTAPVVAIVEGSSVTAVAAGFAHSCAVVDGGVKCWGDNAYGQLGNNSTLQSNVPVVAIPAGSGATAVAAGRSHTCALIADSVKCWGRNSFGQLGDSTLVDKLVPTAVLPTGSGATLVAAGYDHTCAVLQGGVKCWGYNNKGQLGNGTTASSASPVVAFPAGSGATEVAAGSTFTCAVASGYGECWGDTLYGLRLNAPGSNSTPGQNGFLVPPFTPSRISAGRLHACVVVASGAVWCWGEDRLNQLGDTVIGDWTYIGVATALPDGSNATSTASGGGHTCVIVNGGVKCWGDNSRGQLGTLKITTSVEPVVAFPAGSDATSVSAYNNTTCAAVGGKMYCWGFGFQGQAYCATFNQTSTPINIFSPGVQSVSNGNGYCATTESGLFCSAVGTSNITQPPLIAARVSDASVGGGDTCAVVGGGVQCKVSGVMAQVIPTNSGATDVSSGSSHTCAVVNGGVQCWGNNFDGQLGNNSSASSTTPVVAVAAGSGATAVGAGVSHTCAVVNGGVQCWGNNAQGKLGNGSQTLSRVPVTAIPVGSKVTAVASGSGHSCAVVNGGVQCWGDNGLSQLGSPVAVRSLTAVQAIPAGTNISGIAAGGGHSCALGNGGVVCWGANEQGQLGDSSTFITQQVFPGLTTSGGASAPTISAAVGGPGLVTFAITAPTSDGGSPIVGYTASCSAAGHATVSTTATAGSTSITVSGLDGGIAYSCVAAADTSAGHGASSNSLTATTAATPTAVTITSPTSMSAYPAPASVVLAANAVARATTTITKVEFFQDGTTLLGTSTTAPYGYTWTAPVPGTYQVTAKATDSAGGTATSPPVSVVVTLAGETITYLHTDFTGSTVAATDAQGAVIWKEAYKPFGERIVNSAASNANRQLFAGHAFDLDTGLSYMGARYYDPVLSRFMGSDPATLSERHVQGFGRYHYAYDNPYRFVDPDGREPDDIVNGEMATLRATRAPLVTRARETGEYAAQVPEVAMTIATEVAVGKGLGVTLKAVGPLVGVLKNAAEAGRAGRQTRLRELFNDDKVSSAERGWILQEMNAIERGTRRSIRNPPGKELAHERGREAAKGYDYKHANLQDKDLHKLQHKYDEQGRANAERPFP